MKTIVETERLRIREMRIEDYDNLYALDSDPEVMKFISNGKPMEAAAVRSVLERILARYEEWKVYGVWAAELKSSGEFVGWFALKPLPGTSEIEIGYRVLKKNWGEGYATEGAKELLRYGIKENRRDCESRKSRIHKCFKKDRPEIFRGCRLSNLSRGSQKSGELV
jgi:RimJ/RimL family protein N-acetyltransferase